MPLLTWMAEGVKECPKQMDDHNEHTPPIKNACYFIRYKPQDVRARRNTDGNDYEDNTGGKINKKGISF